VPTGLLSETKDLAPACVRFVNVTLSRSRIQRARSSCWEPADRFGHAEFFVHGLNRRGVARSPPDTVRHPGRSARLRRLSSPSVDVDGRQYSMSTRFDKRPKNRSRPASSLRFNLITRSVYYCDNSAGTVSYRHPIRRETRGLPKYISTLIRPFDRVTQNTDQLYDDTCTLVYAIRKCPCIVYVHDH